MRFFPGFLATFLAALTLVVLLYASLATADSLHYTVTDLGTLGSGDASWALGINDLGEVVGYSRVSPGSPPHAFLYRSGTMVDLGTIAGIESAASAINDRGEVVGVSEAIGPGGDLTDTAFLYSNGEMTDLGAAFGFAISQANDINDRGEIVGTDGLTRAFLYGNGAMTILPTPGVSFANGINDLGQVVGTMQTASGQDAFLYSDGVLTDLGTLGLHLAGASDINDPG